MKHRLHLICIVLLIGSCLCLLALRLNAQTLKRSLDCPSVEGQWERIYPNEVSVKQTGITQRTITWNQRSDAARVAIEAISWTKPEGIEGQVAEYPFSYYVTEIVTGQPGRYTYVHDQPIRPALFIGYYLTEYRNLDQDEPCYGYGIYQVQPSQLIFLPSIRR